MASIYFDHNATTALDKRVFDTMLPWMTSQSGNPTSRHVYGRSARDAIENARAQVAEACGAYSSQVVFTSCGTESNNFAIKGISSIKPASNSAQILTSAIEHPCVSQPAIMMQQQGYINRKIDVDSQGKIDLAKLKLQLNTPTGLVSVMLANNETGVIQDINTIAEQALGKIPLNFADLNVHAMTVSSHKIHGPQGAAALILDKKLDLKPLLHGGGQEKGLRSGTENVAAIIGFGAACEIAIKNRSIFSSQTTALRDQLEEGLKALKVSIFSSNARRIPNTSFFSIEGIEGETLVMALDRKGYAVASGSACSSDSTEPSSVLMAMNVPVDTARGAVRVSFSANNTSAQVTGFLATLSNEILRLKQMSAIAV